MISSDLHSTFNILRNVSNLVQNISITTNTFLAIKTIRPAKIPTKCGLSGELFLQAVHIYI